MCRSVVRRTLDAIVKQRQLRVRHTSSRRTATGIGASFKPNINFRFREANDTLKTLKPMACVTRRILRQPRRGHWRPLTQKGSQFCSGMVPLAGIEPALLAESDFEFGRVYQFRHRGPRRCERRRYKRRDGAGSTLQAPIGPSSARASGARAIADGCHRRAAPATIPQEIAGIRVRLSSIPLSLMAQRPPRARCNLSMVDFPASIHGPCSFPDSPPMTPKIPC